MKIIKRKCPKCGSSDVAEILWGYPAFSEELEKALANHEIILGGCCVTENDPSAHCNSCGKDFGKPPFARKRKGQTEREPRELLPDVITSISFSESSFFYGGEQIEITAEGEKHTSVYSHLPYYTEQYIREISNAQWKSLMDTLFYRLCIHEWKHSYKNPYVLDGTQWELILKLTKGRRYLFSGINAYPALYSDLVRTFKLFMKKAKQKTEKT